MAKKCYFFSAYVLRIFPSGPTEHLVLQLVQTNPVFGVVCLFVPQCGQVTVIKPMVIPPSFGMEILYDEWKQLARDLRARKTGGKNGECKTNKQKEIRD